MDKRLAIALQGGRRVSGVLRGFDIFLNLVIDDAYEESGQSAAPGAAKNPLGQIVSSACVKYLVVYSLATILFSRSFAGIVSLR